MSLGFQFFLHTETVGHLGPLEWVFNTPSHHRVHHGRNPEYLDRNFGGIFIIWDRLLGSFAAEQGRPMYGTVHPLKSHHPVVIAFDGWVRLATRVTRAGLDWRHRCALIFARL